MWHNAQCSCTGCRARRASQQAAISQLKAEGRWFEPGEVLTVHTGRTMHVDTLGAQEAMFLNICAIRDIVERVH